MCSHILTDSVNLYATFSIALLISSYHRYISTKMQFPPYSGRFPQIVQSGCIFAAPPPFGEKISVSGHQKSRKGTNPIRVNDAFPSLFLVQREIIVVTTLYSDATSLQTCKNNHPSFVSKLGWLYGTSNGNRTHDFALRGQRLNRLTMEADGWGTRIRT